MHPEASNFMEGVSQDCPRMLPERPRESGAFEFLQSRETLKSDAKKPRKLPGLFAFLKANRRLMTTSKELLQSIFPGRVVLSPQEVAMAMFGKSDRSATNSVRNLLQQGLLIPNLSMVRGRWLIPVAALGQALDDLHPEPLLEMIRPGAGPRGRQSRRAPPPVRIGRVR